MEVVVSDQNYNDFLSTRFVSGNFLQAGFWQAFLKAQGKRFWQLALIENQEIMGVCLVYENCLPLGRSYFYAPKGPIFSAQSTAQQKKEGTALILSKLRDLTMATRRYQEIFCRLEPANEEDILPEFIKTTDIHPRETLVLNLQTDLQDILEKMHPKTRYNIALARKKGVAIRFSDKPEDIKYFLSLIKKTAKRNQIAVHNDRYHQLLLETIFAQGVGQLCLAEAEGKIVAVNIIIRFGEAVTYLHGASEYEARMYMAPQLLQWETIKQSRELGYKFYDFWGIAPADGSKPNWAGVTRFKKGFGGQTLKSPGTYDFVYDQTWYKFYGLARKIRALVR
jgi:peptidoglycan pentaglycine glycine transferase (the first glycine)